MNNASIIATPTTVFIPIHKIRPGHHPDAPDGVMDTRTVGRELGIDELEASIMAVGVINALSVAEGPDGYHYVIAGNGRLAALQSLVAKRRLPKRFLVPVTVREAKVALLLSASENIVRRQVHAADRYVTFRDLVETGSSPASAAASFGVSVAEMKRFVALGSLGPSIVAAWRRDELGSDPMPPLKAFTLASVDHQERAFFEIKRAGGHWRPFQVRAALGFNDDHNVDHAIGYVGEDAYEAAGGRITRSLFPDQAPVYHDPELAKRLARDKAVRLCQALVEAGWAWATPTTDLPDMAPYSWSRVQVADPGVTDDETLKLAELEATSVGDPDDLLVEISRTALAGLRREIEDRACPADVRSGAGCAVRLRGPTVEIIRGLVRPHDARRARAAQDVAGDVGEAPVREGPRLSATLTQRLDVQRTQAVRDALPADPKAGLAILLAGAVATHSAHPVRFRVDRQEPDDGPSEVVTFEAALSRFLTMTLEELAVVATGVTARAVSMSSFGGRSVTDAADAVAAALEPDALRKGLAARFDADDYLRSVTKDQVLEAVAEVSGAEAARHLAGLKKGEIVAAAIPDIKRTGWLPPELRPAGYALRPVGPTPIEIAAAA